MDKEVLLAAPDDGFTNVYILEAFQDLGWHCTPYDYRKSARNLGFQRMQQDLIRCGLDHDLVLALKGESIHPDVWRYLDKEDVTTALWDFDPRNQTTDEVQYRAQFPRHFFTIAKGLVPVLEEKGVNAYWLLEAASRKYHYPEEDVDEDVDVSFIGTVEDVLTTGDGYQDRETWLHRVAEQHPVHLWGSYPGSVENDPNVTYHGRADGDDGFREAVARSKVNLGRDRNPDIERSYGARLFRTLACGGCLLTTKTDGIIEDFGDGIFTYESDDECVDMVDYLLNHPEHRREKVERGIECVRNHHTWTHRLTSLLDTVGFDAHG